MYENLYNEAKDAMQELVDRANLKKGQVVVVGCSTSEIMGARIGSSGTLEVAKEVLRGLREPIEAKGGWLAISAAPTGCRPLGTQERTQWAFPAATATPERTTGNPSPTPARSAPRPAPPRPCHAPGAFPAAVGIPGAQLGPPPIPATTRFPTRAARLRPAPGALPARRPPSPRAPGEPRPHARFQESLWDLAPAAR